MADVNCVVLPITKTKRKRGVRNPDNYKSNVIKRSRVKGLEYINYSGKLISRRSTGQPCRCRLKCFEKIPEDEQINILNNFSNMNTKDEQDVFLLGLIESKEFSKRKRKEDISKKHSSVFSYHIIVNRKRTVVCKNAYMSLLGNISPKRLRRLQSLLLQGKSPKDLRGIGNKNREFPQKYIKEVNDHILTFPVSVSHYSSREYRFLSSELNVQKMYDLFKQKYPHSPVLYKYYIKYFKLNFDLAFGPPQVDTCIKCEELLVKINSPTLNSTAKKVAQAELDVHKRRSKKYYSIMKKTREECQTNPAILGLCFDYCQNLPLPKIPIQDIFYMRQLWVNVFGIQNMQNSNSMLYVYHEGIAKKGANEVCSLLLNYIENYVPHTVKELRLFSDGPFGQNKNHDMIRLCRALVDTKRFDSIKHYFPTRGHSYSACDRDFAIIKRAAKNVERVYDVMQYCEIILHASKRLDKFTITLVDTSDILDFTKWWPNFYKRGGVSEETRGKLAPACNKVRLQSGSFMQFEYLKENPGQVKTRNFIEDLQEHTFNLKLVNEVALPTEKAYEGPNTINFNKIESVFL